MPPIAAYKTDDTVALVKPDLTEDAPLADWNGPAHYYNRGKAESERLLRAIIGEKLTIVRPGPIKGSLSLSDELLTWFWRMQRDRSVIAPGDGTGGVEIVDAKDVAQFLALAIDRSIYGAFNLTGRSMTYREFLNECQSATHSNAELVWMPLDYLKAQGISPEDFPFLRPGSNIF